MNSTFTLIGSIESRTRWFWPLHLKSKIYKVEDWRSQRLKKSKFKEVEDWRSRSLKKSKIEEVEDWRSRSLKKSKIEEVEVWRSRRLKIWSLETQPESATQVESRGLLTWICPLGTRGLVYQVWPIKKVDRHKDSKIDLKTKKGKSNPYSTRTLVKP
jgi:hypothetical protein